MNAKQFLRKFPDAERNTNCLTDMACPKCGNRERFNVEVKTIMELQDMGSGDHADIEHDATSFCQCLECAEEGTVADFTIEGLDDEIESRREKQ